MRVEAAAEPIVEGGNATFTLHRYGGRPSDSLWPLSVKVQVSQNGEFIQGDTPQVVIFAGTPGGISINAPPGELSKTVSIPTVNDLLDEADGEVVLTVIPLTAEEAAESVYVYEPETRGGNSGWSHIATVQVLDDDEVGFSIADTAAVEADGRLEFEVTLPVASDLATSVDWVTASSEGDHPATPDVDYASATGTLTFAPTETSKMITIVLHDDDLKEEDETLGVELTNPSGGSLSRYRAIGTISNDDEAQTISILSDEDAGKVVEGADVVFRLKRCTNAVSPDGACTQNEPRNRLVVDLEVVTMGEFFAGPAPVTAVFEAGSWTAAATVPTIDDKEFESTGSVSLSIGSAGAGLITSATPHTVAVYDNDVPVSISDGDANENDGFIGFAVSLQEPAILPVTVEVFTRDGKASSHGAFTPTDFSRDFEAKREILVFEEGDQFKFFLVALTDDFFDEVDEEDFSVELGTPINAQWGDHIGTGAILDNEDPVEVSFATPTVTTFDENHSGPLRFRLKYGPRNREWVAERETVVHWKITGGPANDDEYAATHGEDYVEASGSVRMPPGHTALSHLVSYMVELNLLDDDIFENTELEILTLTLTGAENLKVIPNGKTLEIKIRDDDVATAGITADAKSVTEGQTASFTMTLAGDRQADVFRLEYELLGTAVKGEGEDYTASQLIFGDDNLGASTVRTDEATRTISIVTLNDGEEEPDETVTLKLTRARTVPGARDLRVVGEPATVAILDAGTSFVSIEDAPTGNFEGDALEFTVNLSEAVTEETAVDWRTPQNPGEVSAYDSATPGLDYEVSMGAVTIPAGSVSGTFTVQTLDDSVAGEQVERFVVTLTGASRGDSAVALGDHTAFGAFLDNDSDAPTEVTLSISPDEVHEGAGTTQVSVTATLKGAKSRSRDTTVSVNVAGETAEDAVDFTATPATVIIPAGVLSGHGTLTLALVDDNIAEGNETAQVSGTAVSSNPGDESIQMTVTPATVTISDNDQEPTGIALAVDPGEVAEGDGAAVLVVTAKLAGDSTRSIDTQVTLTVEGASPPQGDGDSNLRAAASGGDFTASTATLTIPAGALQGTGTMTLTVVDDTMAEGQETAQVNGAADGLTVSPAPVTITDNDEEPTRIKLSVSPSEIVEDGGEQTLNVTATLVGGGSRIEPTEVSVSVHGVTAIAGEDFSQPPGVTVSIPAGQLTESASLTLSPVDDRVHEGDEKLALRGANTYPGLPVAEAGLSIIDDDVAPTRIALSLDKEKVSEDAGAEFLTVTARFEGDSLRVIDTPIMLTASHISTTDDDFFVLTVGLSIPAAQGEGEATILLAPMDDSVDEDDEILEVRGATAEADFTISHQQVTIIDDDNAGVSISPETLPVLEGGSALYSIVLTSDPTADVTITISGHEDAELSLNKTTLTFTSANWNIPQTVTVRAAEDDDSVSDASVTLAHAVSGTGEYASVTAESVSVTITENDTAGVSIDPTALTVVEGQGKNYTVVLDSQPSADVSVTVSGHAGTDITLGGTTLNAENQLTFTTVNWNTAQTVSVTAAEDDDAATDASVTLAHAVTSTDTLYNGATAGSVAVAITENDSAGVSIDPTALIIQEGQSETYTVALTTQPSADVTVTISGHANTDITLSGIKLNKDHQLTFTSTNWDTAQTVTVAAAEDDDAATDASVTLAHTVRGTGEYASVTAESVWR